MFLVLIRRRRARLQLHKTATGLQPICNQIRPPYDRTTAIRPPYVCLEVCLCCNRSATSCNQVRPPYDRHTSVWRSVCTATDLQPHAIRYDRHTTAIRLFGGLFVLQPICNQIRPPYDRNQERRPPYVIHVIGNHKICLRYRRYRRYRTLEKLRAGEALFFVLYLYIYNIDGLRNDCNQDQREKTIKYIG